MEIDFDDIRPLLSTYVESHGDVFRASAPDELWLRRASTQYQEWISDIPLTDLSVSHLGTLIDPFFKIEIDSERLVDRHPATTTGRWEGFKRVCADDPSTAATKVSNLFDMTVPIEERLQQFQAYFRTEIETLGQRFKNIPQSISPGPMQGLPTTILELVFPDKYAAYKFGVARNFFDQYSDYEVRSAANIAPAEQYPILLDGWRTLRDELQDFYPDANMLDVHAIMWNVEELEQTAAKDSISPPPSPPPRAELIESAISASGQVIFYGPPGTGKTYSASKFAEWWTRRSDQHDQGSVRTLTFHPSVSYEDFVEGLQPTQASGAEASFELTDGIFKRMAEEAARDYARTPSEAIPPRHVLVVDELNRGEVASIFGELVTAIEADKRLDQPQETSVVLSHSGDEFVIPPNLYLLGTMNTADRSISLIDAAIRRRFRFLHYPPSFDLIRREYRESSGEVAEMIRISIDSLKCINERLRNDLSRGKQIGHAYLFDVGSLNQIREVWRFEILPLLEEYYYDQFDHLRESVFRGGGDEIFDWERQHIRSFDIEALRTTLTELR